MRNLKRLLCLALSLALVVSIVGINEAFVDARADSFDQSLVNQFTDIKGHWANEGLTNLIGYGYMRGVGNNQAAPNETLTTAQLVALLVRIMGGSEEADLSGYVDMDKGAWYYSEIAQGLNMGIIPNTNTNYINPNQQASREYAAYMLCRAFGLTVREPLDDFSDADKVSDWAVSSMQAMVAADAIVGTSGKAGRYLNPQETITRAEFAQMVYRLVNDFVQVTDSTNIRKQTFDGGLLVSRSGVSLRDCTIKGNLYIADAVGAGDISLENTKVEGNIYARGCGDRSIHLEEGTTANSVVLINPYCATRLVVDEDSTINGVLVNNGTDEVTLQGNVGNVVMNVSDVDLTFEEANASTVIINSADSTITVDKDSVVDTMSIASSSSGVTVDSKGKVNRLAQMANDATLNLDGTLDYLLIGAVSDLDLKLDSGITLGALDLHCSNSTISVNSEVKTISVSAFSDKLKLDLGKSAKVLSVGIASTSTDLTVHSDATVGTVTIDAPKYKGKVSSDLNTLVIGAGATEAEVTLAKDTDITNLIVSASKVKIEAENGSTVTDLSVTGKDNEIFGQGAVTNVNVATTASGTKVTTPNTKVANAGAANVTAGGIEVPFNKTYTTTATGKDVIRNNDGTPDGDGDRTTGAGDEVATVANFELTYAAQATASDIHSSGKWTLDDLGSGLTLTKNTTGSGASYKLTGNVKKVDNFSPVHDAIAGYGTGYYVPVILTADSMATETEWTATANGFVYNKSNLSAGAGYAGKLMLYVQLQSGTTSKVTYVTFDRDGSGDKYTPVTVSIDYSGVTFDGAQDLTGEVISYPVNAAKNDLTTDNAFALADFGTFNVAKGNTATNYNVSGTAHYIDREVKGNVGTAADAHHYLPLMVNVSGFKPGWTIVLDDGSRFTSSNVSRGDGCKGNLVMLLPIVSGTKTSYTMYFDKDGDGRTDDNGTVTLNCAGVVLSPTTSGGTSGEEVPAGLTVTLNTVNWTVTILDEASVFGSDWSATDPRRVELATKAVMAQLTKEEYTNITTATEGNTLLFQAYKGSPVARVFTLSLETGITAPSKEILVSYKLADKAAKDVTLEQGATVSDLLDAVIEAGDTPTGDYYSRNGGAVKRNLTDASKDVLADGDEVVFDYFLVTTSKSAALSNDSVSISISQNNLGSEAIVQDGKVYALKGATLSVEFTVSPMADDAPIDGPASITVGYHGIFTVTGGSIAFGTLGEGLTLSSDKKSLTADGNEALTSIAITGTNSLGITVTPEKELTVATFALDITVDGDVTFDLSGSNTGSSSGGGTGSGGGSEEPSAPPTSPEPTT